MKQYLELGRELIAKYDKTQTIRQDRTNTGTVSLFGRQMRFDLSEGFPLVTTKKVFLRGIIEELLWMLAGDTNNNTLLDKNVHIWDQWAIEDGGLGPIYGAQWRSWPNYREVERKRYSINERYQLAVAAAKTDQQKLKLQTMARHYGLMPGVAPLEERCVSDEQKATLMVAHADLDTFKVPRTYLHVGKIDQIAELIKNLKAKPYSRRHIVSAWNVADLPNESVSPQENVLDGRAALSSCHTMFQFYVEDLSFAERGELARKRDLVSVALLMAQGADEEEYQELFDAVGIPSKKLSCQLYQR